MGMKAAHWHCYDNTVHYYSDAPTGTALALITNNPVDWTIKVMNRNGGYNYAVASSLPAAKRKAVKMIREEQK
jgi:hypothetical protein